MRILIALLLTLSVACPQPGVISEVAFDKDKGDFLYTYEVVNSEGPEEIILFGVYPLAPVYEVKSPKGWNLLINDGGRIVWTAGGEGIEPGKRICCFSFRSKYDLTFGYSEVKGEEAGFVEEVRVPGNEDVRVVVEVNPLIANLKLSRPTFFTLYIRTPPGLKGKEIDPESLFLQGAKPVAVRKVCDGTFMARFDPDHLLLSSRFTWNVYLWGRLRDGTPFLGIDSIVVEGDKNIRPLQGRRFKVNFRVSSSFELEADGKSCRVDISIPKEAHRALLKSLGDYRIYTEFPEVSCENLESYVGKRVAPWIAFGDINGDGREDAFLRVLTGKGRVKKVVELFLVSSADTYEVHSIWEEALVKDRPKFYGRPKEVLSPCKIGGVSGIWSMEILFGSDCIALSVGSHKELATFYYLYLNGRLERIEYAYEPP